MYEVAAVLVTPELGGVVSLAGSAEISDEVLLLTVLPVPAVLLLSLLSLVVLSPVPDELPLPPLQLSKNANTRSTVTAHIIFLCIDYLSSLVNHAKCIKGQCGYC